MVERSISEGFASNLTELNLNRRSVNTSIPLDPRLIEPSLSRFKLRDPLQRFGPLEEGEGNYHTYPSVAGFLVWRNTSANAELGRSSFFGYNKKVVGLQGLYGCTAIVVTSRYGLYMAKFFEYPSFVGSAKQKKQDNLFWRQVILLLKRGLHDPDGYIDHPGLSEGMGNGTEYFPGVFKPGSEIQAAIISPKDPHGPGFQYPGRVEQIEAMMREVLRPAQQGPDLVKSYYYPRPGTLPGYPRGRDKETRDRYMERLDNSWYGKIAVQYKDNGYLVSVMNDKKPLMEDLWPLDFKPRARIIKGNGP